MRLHEKASGLSIVYGFIEESRFTRCIPRRTRESELGALTPPPSRPPALQYRHAIVTPLHDSHEPASCGRRGWGLPGSLAVTVV